MTESECLIEHYKPINSTIEVNNKLNLESNLNLNFLNILLLTTSFSVLIHYLLILLNHLSNFGEFQKPVRLVMTNNDQNPVFLNI